MDFLLHDHDEDEEHEFEPNDEIISMLKEMSGFKQHLVNKLMIFSSSSTHARNEHLKVFQ
jgi:hypothetical protein